MARKTVVKKKKKDNSTRNAILAFLFAMIALCGLFGAHKASNFLICGLLSAFIAVVIKIATSPMKGLDAPGNSTGIIVEDVEDEYARDMIATGLSLLEELGRERDAIAETIFTRRINDFITVFKEMLSIVNRDYSKAPHLRKMNSYYIPTIIKLLQAYRDAKAQGTSYMEIATAREKLLKTLDQLVQAASNIKKKMVKTNLERMDITREVLDDTLRADGYIETEEVADLRKSAADASRDLQLSAQLGGSAPVQQPAPQPAPVQKPAPVYQAAPQAAPTQKPAPGLTMDATQQARQSTAAPTLQPNIPTAAAQQLSQGAPLLNVPGLFEDAEESTQTDDNQSMMF
ncbi:MAG: 5-bromo-4-chloroindolyl phosphate hydrolysis family protein [Clostridia bacterium]|nr:5-bromo-4-chloroindolyl phosphate hydrolysis family protein [Clostridia bacterium]